MFRLRVFHHNDLHGRLAGLDANQTAPVFSRMAAHVAAARAACAGMPDEAVLFFSVGDDLVGSPFAALAGTHAGDFRCHPAYRLYSAAGVDAGAIGNHDLDWGLAMLALAAERDAAFPLVSANIASAFSFSGIVPAITLTVKGRRIGVIGVTTAAEIKRPIPGEFEITDPIAAVRDLSEAMRPHCDAIILLSHLGYSIDHPAGIVTGAGDAELARALPYRAVDLILGAHTHNALNRDGLEPGHRINGIAVAQAGALGEYLGEMMLDVGANRARVTGARLLKVSDLPEAPKFEATHVRPLIEQTEALMREPLGCASAHPDLEDAAARAAFASQESALANFVADALAACCRRADIPVDFAFVDASVISAGLPAGPVTLEDLHRLAPFADSIVTLQVPRGALQAFLDDNARRALVGQGAQERGFAHFSAEIRYVIGDDRAEEVTFQGAPVADWTDGPPLRVACGSFARVPARAWERAALAAGALLFDIHALKREQTGLPLRAALCAHIRQIGVISESTGLRCDGRVRQRTAGAG